MIHSVLTLCRDMGDPPTGEGPYPQNTAQHRSQGTREGPCGGFAGQEVGRCAGERIPLYLSLSGLGFREEVGLGLRCAPTLCALRASTYRDPEGSGPAVIQHGAVVGVLQGILH